MPSVHSLQPLWQILQVKKWFEASRFNISKNNSKSTLLSFQDKKSLGNPQQTSSFRTCLTPEHIIKIQNLLDLIYFKAACSKYQSVNETNTKIQLNKSFFGKQEIFSRLGQIQANLMVLEFQATGDNALMQWWDNGGHHQVVMRMMIQTSSPHRFPHHPSHFHHRFSLLKWLCSVHSFTKKYCWYSQTNTVDCCWQIQFKEREILSHVFLPSWLEVFHFVFCWRGKFPGNDHWFTRSKTPTSTSPRTWRGSLPSWRSWTPHHRLLAGGRLYRRLLLAAPWLQPWMEAKREESFELQEEMSRWLFNCDHHFFDEISMKMIVTTKEAFEPKSKSGKTMFA